MGSKQLKKLRITTEILALRRFMVVKHAFPLALVTMVIFLGVFFLHRTFICNFKATQVGQLRATVEANHIKEQYLRNKKLFLQTPEGIKAKGIEKGYLEKGDYPVRFTPQQSATTAPVIPVAGSTSDNSSVIAALVFIFVIVFIISIAFLLYRRWKLRTPISENVITPRAGSRRPAR